MEEIKETKTKKIIKFLLDHIMVISAIIFLCVLLFSSCSTVKAADIGANYDDILFEQCEKYNIDYSEISSYLRDYPYIISFDCGTHFIALFIKDYSNSTTNYLFPCFFSFGSNLSNYISDMKVTSEFSVRSEPEFANVSADASLDCLYLTITSGSYNLQRLYKFTSGGSSNTQNNNYFSFKTWYAYPSSSGSQRLAYKSYSYTWYYYKILAGSDIFTNTDTYIGRYYANLYKLTPNIGHSYTEDSRLKIYSINDNAGNRSIVFDIDDFNFSNYSGNDAATQNTLYENKISVTVDYDGTEQIIILDNTNSDILPAYLIETPYSFFNLGEYTSVKITKVEFSKLIHYMPSEMREDEIENYYISCEYYLKRPESAPEASDIPYNSNVDNTKITQLQIDEKNEIINYDNGYYSPSGGGGDPMIIPDGYTVKLITVTGSDTLASILNDIYNGRYILNGLSGIYQFADDVVDYITGINTTDQFMEFMEDSIKNNNYSLLYDFVVYYWAPDASLGEPDVMYYYLTNSGKLRTINKTLADIWKESNQVSVNTGSLYDYLKERLDDFENKTLDLLYGNNKLVESSNEWLQTINNTLSNLSFSDPFDDSDLLDKLDYVISILDNIAGFFSGDSNEGYSKFTKWIEEIEDDGEITPHEWANDIFNYVTGLYHSLSDGTSYYTNDITDYINYVNQDGNSDPGNYFFAMYEGTYDPHNYYGWTGGTNE